MVIMLTQVSQNNILQPGMEDLGQDPDSLIVREVSVDTLDPLFNLPGIGPFHQHSDIVITLKDQGRSIFQILNKQSGAEAEICCYTKFPVRVSHLPDSKIAAVDCIV